MKLNTGLSDEDLAVAAACQPDDPPGRRAACALLERYTRPVYRWCYDRVRDPDLAEDLAQEVLLRAWQKLDLFDPRGRFSAWLFVITRNFCLEKLRRPSIAHDPGVEVDSLADPRAAPDGELEDMEEETALLELVKRTLSEQERDAIWLRCMEGMPVDTITRVLRIEQATGARAVLQNARRKLRAALERGEESRKQ